MKLKRIVSVLAATILVAFSAAFTTFAEETTEDIEMSVSRAVFSNGMWGQSITYSEADIDASRFTENTQIKIEFELDGELSTPGIAPVELIFQNYEATPQIWAKIAPDEYDNTYAVFNYEDMVLQYGSDDFSTVNNICIGDCGVKMKVTKFTVTNCKTIVVTEAATTTAATETPENTPEETTTVTEADPNEPAEEDSINMTLIIIIIVATVVVAGVVVTLIVVKKNRKRFY